MKKIKEILYLEDAWRLNGHNPEWTSKQSIRPSLIAAIIFYVASIAFVVIYNCIK